MLPRDERQRQFLQFCYHLEVQLCKTRETGPQRMCKTEVTNSNAFGVQVGNVIMFCDCT